MLMLGFDIGGTFTDLSLFDGTNGEIRVTKVPSNAADPAAAVTNGLKDLGVPASSIDTIIHGTTVTTNALLQRKGAKVALITTEGFGDLIEIGRTMRMMPGLFNTKFVRAEPLVPRDMRLEVHERTLGTGGVLYPLESSDIERVGADLEALGAQAAAICFLNSYQSPVHETRLAQALEKRFPGVYVVASSSVIAEFREYERFNTTAVNAFLGPLLARYLDNLAEGLKALGYSRRLYVMSSSGGILTVAGAAAHAERTLLSGPVGGVNAAIALGSAIGVSNVITYDMGGTSTDVCLIENLTPAVITESIIDGVSFKAVHIDIHTVGAGGGSIATSELPGDFRVGPESAGARPGPACYGFGGIEATVTDANLVLGRLGTGGLIGGRMQLDVDASRAAIERLGNAIGIRDVHRVAQGIIEIAVAKMVGAIREISVHRGHDPREYALVSFGGAGPMHAVEVAREFGAREVVIPRHPGNFSALGLLSSDLRHDYVKTHLARLSELETTAMWDMISRLEEAGQNQLLSEGVSADRIELRYSADVRYMGQGSELSVSLERGTEPLNLAKTFHAAHQQNYGHSRPSHPVELVNLRVAAMGRLTRPEIRNMAPLHANVSTSKRPVYFDGREYDCPVFDRAGLASDWRTIGPAIIEEFGSTTVLTPGWEARMDVMGNLRLQPEQRQV